MSASMSDKRTHFITPVIGPMSSSGSSATSAMHACWATLSAAAFAAVAFAAALSAAFFSAALFSATAALSTTRTTTVEGSLRRSLHTPPGGSREAADVRAQNAWPENKQHGNTCFCVRAHFQKRLDDSSHAASHAMLGMPSTPPAKLHASAHHDANAMLGMPDVAAPRTPHSAHTQVPAAADRRSSYRYSWTAVPLRSCRPLSPSAPRRERQVEPLRQVVAGDVDVDVMWPHGVRVDARLRTPLEGAHGEG
jgi:hypothetical protein